MEEQPSKTEKGKVIPVSSAKRLRSSSAPFNRSKGLTNITSVLSELTNKLGLDRRLKERALMNLWPVVVGDSLAQKSRPLFIDNEGKLVITVKEAAVGQDLSLSKTSIVKHLRKVAASLGIKITDIRFDLKHFHTPIENNASPDSEPQNQFLKVNPSRSDLDAVTLTEEELSELKNLAGHLKDEKFSSTEETLQEIPERILSLFEQELRLLKWQTLKGFPICSECSSPTPYLHGERGLCNGCYLESFEKSHQRS